MYVYIYIYIYMAQCKNREVWNSRVGVHVSYPFHTPLLKSPFHTLFHTPVLTKRFIPLLSNVSYPVSYPVSNPVKVCCRNHADVSKGILKFHFQHVFSSLNFQLCYIPVAYPVSYPAKASYPVSYPVMLRYVLEVKSGKSRAGWRLGRPGSKEPGRLQI